MDSNDWKWFGSVLAATGGALISIIGIYELVKARYPPPPPAKDTQGIGVRKR